LATWEARAWALDPKHIWEQETVAMIEGLKNAASARVVEAQYRKKEDYSSTFPFSGPPAGVSGYTPTEIDNMGKAAWEDKYIDYLNQEKLNDFKAKHEAEEKAFLATLIEPLDKAYVGWLESEQFSSHLIHNYDSCNLQSGMVYQQLVHNIIHDA